MSWRRIKDIRNLFRQEKETEAIKDRIFNFECEHEEVGNYYKPARITVILKTKVAVIKIKHFKLKDVLIKLYYI